MRIEKSMLALSLLNVRDKNRGFCGVRPGRIGDSGFVFVMLLPDSDYDSDSGAVLGIGLICCCSLPDA